MADELARWARERAPELLARAESEAVTVLRNALVRAALGERTPDSPEPAARPATEEAPRGELLWAYCVLRERDQIPEGMPGVDPAAEVERVEAGDLAALVSRVPRAEFAEEPLKRNLNDLPWLERVARAHEAVLEGALATTSIVPLRLCTLYDGEENVRHMLDREDDVLLAALDVLHGRQEWGVKVLIDRERLVDEARARSDEAAALEKQLKARSGGGAYMLRRRLERHVREQTDSLAAQVADQIHARLQDWAVDAVTRPPQNRELSGHEGEMLLNAAYLIETARVDELRELVADLETRHGELGIRIELTGPWPPYNFVPGSDKATIA